MRTNKTDVWTFWTRNEAASAFHTPSFFMHSTSCSQVFPKNLLDTAIGSVQRKIKLSGGYGFNAAKALKQPCTLSISCAQAHLISSPHSAWKLFHLLHMDGCSTVKLSPNGTDALQCPVQRIWCGGGAAKKNPLEDQLKSSIFNKKHCLFKAHSAVDR